MGSPHQFYLSVFIECEFVVIVGCVVLLIGWLESPLADIVNLRN